MSKTSLDYQRQCGEHAIPFLVKAGVEQEIINGLKDLCLTAAFFSKRAELTREIVRLNREAGYLAELFQMFPGSQVSAVRFRCPKCSETMIDDQYEIGRDA